MLKLKLKKLFRSKYNIFLFLLAVIGFLLFLILVFGKKGGFEQIIPEKQSEQKEMEGRLDPAGRAVEEELNKRPWLKNLPIETENYSIYYLPEKQAIRVLMMINVLSSVSREKQVEQIKLEVPQKLKEIGVDLQKESFYYTFTP